jgi:DNA polymerase delta subunit 4
MDVEEKILRHFDLSSQYGVSSTFLLNNDTPLTFPQPCIGISRAKRWHRAHQLKLNPPIEVLAVLLKGKDTKQEAYIGELLS